MQNILLRHIHFFIFFIFGSLVYLQAIASTETEIEAKLNSSLDILIRELPKIKSKNEAADFIRVHIIPVTDISITSRIMLGKYWRQATKLQQERFMAAMTEQLINIYSVFLVDIDSDVKFDITRITKQEGKRADKYVVYSKVTTNTAVDVIFKIYKRKGKDWKIVDVSVEGISLALNWRNTLNDLIRKPADLEAVIVKLENKALEMKENVK